MPSSTSSTNDISVCILRLAGSAQVPVGRCLVRKRRLYPPSNASFLQSYDRRGTSTIVMHGRHMDEGSQSGCFPAAGIFHQYFHGVIRLDSTKRLSDTSETQRPMGRVGVVFDSPAVPMSLVGWEPVRRVINSSHNRWTTTCTLYPLMGH